MATDAARRRVPPPLFLLVFIMISSLSSIHSADPLFTRCYKTNNYTADSTYAANLNTVLTSIASNTYLDNFRTATAGSGNDTSYGLLQCRGDVVNSTDCSSCASEATSKIRQGCPGQTSRGWASDVYRP